MKIGTTESNTLITSAEQTQRSKFSIQASGKAFQVLSSSLYQHKVRAVVREIGCNAYDAHIDAGNTQTPFKVSLPCKEDPHFKVRDYGIGLPEDKFVEIYTTYFGSTKSNSNDSTGGFGLGSKTPFIMSKVFTVHSYYNGIEYMWHSYVNDNGEPDVVLLTQKETTEPNGLLVIVPIGQGQSETEKTALFREFRSEAEEIYQWFDTIPEVTVGGQSVTITPRLHGPKTPYGSIKLKGVDDTTVFYELNHSKGPQAPEILIKMGNVVYPYKLTEVRSLDRFGGNVLHTEAVIKYLTNNGRLNNQKARLVIEVGMGAVDIAPSRESLSLVNTTEVTIINAVVRFVDMYFDLLQSNIDNAKTTFEKYQNMYAIPPISGRGFIVDGQNVNPHSQSPIWAFGSKESLAGRTNFLRSFAINDLVVKYRRANTRGILPLKTSFDMTMYGADLRNRSIILVDKEYKGELRLWVNANVAEEASVVVVFGRNEKNGPRPLTDAEMAPFLRDGHPQVVKFSQLKHAPAVAPSTAKPTLRLSDETYFELGVLSRYNFFTQGNSTVKAISKDAKPFNPNKNVIEELYVCYERKSNIVYAYLKDPDPQKNEASPVEVATWSRSSYTSSSHSVHSDSLNEIFNEIPGRIPGAKSKLKYTINGKEYAVKSVKHVVLNKDGYKDIVGNPDYPTFINVDTAIREVYLPVIPTNIETHEITGEFMNVDRTSSWAHHCCEVLRLHTFSFFISETIRLYNANTLSSVVKDYTSNRLVKNFKYLPATGANVQRHVYTITDVTFLAALREAAANKVRGAAELVNMLQKWNNNVTLYYIFTPSRDKEAQKFAWGMMEYVLMKEGYNSGELSDFLVQYFKKNHTVH